MYSIGGWITIPGSCNRGFRSRPSAAGGKSRSKGLEVSSMNSRKPTLTNPITPTTRATISSGRSSAEHGDGDGPDAEHQHPQEQRALVRTPGRSDAVVQRQLGVGVGRDVEHREIVGGERPAETHERDRDKHELPLRRRPGERHPLGHAACRADERKRCPARARASTRGSGRTGRSLGSFKGSVHFSREGSSCDGGARCQEP